MYNILIVEDEMFVRIGIANCIDWESNGINTPLQAANGKEAWEIIQNHDFDIVLTDIKMPEMDGIILVKKIREADLSVEVIVLSCFNEFELVQKAIRLGVRDYIFKPTLMPEEILKAIKKVINKIEGKRKTLSTVNSLQSHLPELKEYSILQFIHGRELDFERWSEVKQELNINPLFENVILILVKIDIPEEIILDRFNNDEFFLRSAVKNKLKKILNEYDNCDIVCKENQEYLILFSPDVIKEELLERQCNIMFEKVAIGLKDLLGINTTAGVSDYQHTINTLKEAYQEATYAVGKSFFLGKGKIILYHDAKNNNESVDIEINELMQEIDNLDEADYVNKISNIFTEIRRNPSFKIGDVVEISANIIFAMLKNVIKFKGILDELYQTEDSLYKRIYNASSIEEIEEFLFKVAEDLDTILDHQYRNEIQKAIRYMEEHLGDNDIGLKTVASYVNMSKNYFSRLFKENTDVRFIKYLTKLRIEKAQELYMNNDLKVYQIAEKVGYSDWRYFSKVYKKYTGESLSQFKQ